jgi:hypothetical protein
MTTRPEKKRPRQLSWLVSVFLTAAVVGLHFFFRSHAGGFWRDEVNLINLAGCPSLGGMARDSFPGLMPLLVRGWTLMVPGQGEWRLRLLGTLIGLGIVGALWMAAWTTRRSPPLLGLVLLALNSTLVAYGNSIRAYGLGTLLVVLNAAAAAAFLKRSTPARAAWLVLFAVLSVQALYQNIILVVAICAGSWAVCVREKQRRPAFVALAAAAAAAMSLLPYVPIVLAGRASAEVMRTGLKFKTAFANLTNATGFPLGSYVYVWALLALLIVGGGFALFRRRAKSPDEDQREGAIADMRLFAGVTAAAALAGFAGFLWFAALPTQPWYFLPLMALLAVCFDAGLPPLSPLLRLAQLTFVAATAMMAVAIAHRDLNYRYTNVDLLARQLAATASPQDFVVVTPWYSGVSFNYYFKSPVPWTTLPPLADHLTHHYDWVREQMKKTNAIQPVLDQITATLKAGGRVWVAADAGWMDIPDPGTPSPYDLPPPPLKSTGWWDVPYALQWSSQTAHFLGNHSREFKRVKGPAMGGSRVGENLELFMAAGWKDSGPISAPHPETNKP